MKRINYLLMPVVVCFALNSNAQVKESGKEKNINKPLDKTTLTLNPNAAPEIPLEDFFKNPEKTQYKISPDGTYLSWLAPAAGRMNLFVENIQSKNVIQLTQITDRDIAGYMWGNASTLLFMKDNGGDENYVIYSVKTGEGPATLSFEATMNDGTGGGGSATALTPESGVRANLIDEMPNDDDHVLIETNERNPQVFDPYLLNVNSGERTILEENPGNISSWLMDHNGKLRVATSTDGVNTSMLYKSDAGKWETVVTTNFTETIQPLFFTFDNQNLYCLSNIGRDKAAVVEYNLAKHGESIVVYQHDEVDVENMSYSSYRKALTAITYVKDKREFHFLDKRLEEDYNYVKSQLGDYEISFSSKTKDESTYVVRTYSDRSMGAYYLYETKRKSLTKIEDVSPWLNEKEMCMMQPISFSARDGRLIHGYLTLPNGAGNTNLPLVVNPHGGPWARDEWGFNPEVQFLANRGYAVLQINFRGSTGYGKEFWMSSFKQWGKTMQDDITDGVKYLVSQKMVDSKRVAIYGASYGGYATLAGLAFTPDMYACGIDYVGVSNLFTFMKTIPPYWQPYLEMMYAMVGDPVKDKKLMEDASPVMHADKITAPLMVVQGAKDPRVNIDESNQMVDALKKRGVEVMYLVKENEGHGFRNEENRFEFYNAMEKFLNTHISVEGMKRKAEGK
ncbi:MAG: prolyl oligopeptidase family serine peptidase [Flavobacteriales bacterium]